MIKFLLTLFIGSTGLAGIAQQINGQYKGYFEDVSSDAPGSKERYEYVLDLQSNGRSVTGFSYTYFNESGKRYYSICRVIGFIDPKSKYVEVQEVERIKTNIPANHGFCLQVHKLKYDKKTEPQNLYGQWIPSSNLITKDCGYGNTRLSWRPVEITTPALANVSKLPAKNNSTAKNSTPPKVKAKPAESKMEKFKEIVVEQHKPLTYTHESQRLEVIPEEITTSYAKKDDRYKSRSHHLQKTIRVTSEFVNLHIYDNGEIDGDSISIFFNGYNILKNQRLTDKPITLQLPISRDKTQNELVMYAENLGSIPPNTALMIISDNSKRYEVRVSCDLQKNAVIHFVRDANEPKQF